MLFLDHTFDAVLQVLVKGLRDRADDDQWFTLFVLLHRVHPPLRVDPRLDPRLVSETDGWWDWGRLGVGVGPVGSGTGTGGWWDWDRPVVGMGLVEVGLGPAGVRTGAEGGLRDGRHEDRPRRAGLAGPRRSEVEGANGASEEAVVQRRL